jgi:hypothetical protein
MKRNRKIAIAAACLIALLAVGCLAALSQCESRTASVVISESKNSVIEGKPRIVKLQTSTASNVDKQSVDNEVEENATVPSLEEEIVTSSDGGNIEESYATDTPVVPNPPQQDDGPFSAEPSKRWVVDYKQIWVEDSPAWDEQIPVYSHIEESVCNVCGAVITGNEAQHGKTHMIVGEGSGHHTEYVDEIVGYDTVHHDAVGHWETVEDGGHWE